MRKVYLWKVVASIHVAGSIVGKSTPRSVYESCFIDQIVVTDKKCLSALQDELLRIAENKATPINKDFKLKVSVKKVERIECSYMSEILTSI